MSADVDGVTNVMENATESAAKGAVKKAAKTQKKQQKTTAGGKGSKKAKEADAVAKSSKKNEQTYPLTLTLFQRESLLKQTRLRGKLKKKIVEAGRGTKVVPVTLEELNILDDQVGLAAYLADGTYRRHMVAILDRVSAILEEVDAATPQLDASATASKSTGKKVRHVYQFLIVLEQTDPPIWRRIQVENCTFDTFSEHILAAMGWEGHHLHHFEIQGTYFGDPEKLGGGYHDFEGEDSTKTKLDKVLSPSRKRVPFKYEYDFGDGWLHNIVFEGIRPVDPAQKYPLCMDGEQACPPEDCGGLEGYYRILDAYYDSDSDEHEEMLDWFGDDFDPSEFDPKQATKQMRS